MARAPPRPTSPPCNPPPLLPPSRSWAWRGAPPPPPLTGARPWLPSPGGVPPGTARAPASCTPCTARRTPRTGPCWGSDPPGLPPPMGEGPLPVSRAHGAGDEHGRRASAERGGEWWWGGCTGLGGGVLAHLREAACSARHGASTPVPGDAGPICPSAEPLPPAPQLSSPSGPSAEARPRPCLSPAPPQVQGPACTERLFGSLSCLRRGSGQPPGHAWWPDSPSVRLQAAPALTYRRPGV